LPRWISARGDHHDQEGVCPRGAAFGPTKDPPHAMAQFQVDVVACATMR
jgi:hypothetical protein